MDGEGAEDYEELASRGGLILGALSSRDSKDSCFLCLPIPPSRSDEEASGIYLCVRQGLRALRLTRQVSFWGAVPFLSKGFFSVQSSLLFFLVLSWCVGFCQPSKAFLASATLQGCAP